MKKGNFDTAMEGKKIISLIRYKRKRRPWR